MMIRLSVVNLVYWSVPAWAQESTPPPKPKPTVAIQAEKLALKPGQPLSARTLVFNPPPIKGLISWSLETRRHRGLFSTSALSADGLTYATGGLDGTVRIWSTESGQLLRALVGHDSYCYGLDFSPDGSVLASAGSFDSTIRLWDVRSGMPLRTLKGSPSYLVQVAWSPDGQSILGAGGDSGTMSRWHAATGNYQTKHEFGMPVLGISWRPDSKMAAIAVAKLPLQIWDADTNKIKETVGEVTSDFRCVAWSPDGKRLAAGTGTHTAIYDGDTLKEIMKLEGQAAAVTWSADGKCLATSMTSAAAIRIWDADGKMIKSIPGVAYTMQFGPDGKTLVGENHSSFAVYDITDGKPRRQVACAGTLPPLWWAGRPLVTGVGTPKISLWDATTGKPLKTLEGHTAAVNALVWSPDGKQVATASSDKTVRIWDVASGKNIRTFEGHTAAVVSLAWSADGKLLASGGYDKQALIWEASTTKVLHTVKGFQDVVSALAWMPGGGGQLAAGSYDRKVQIINGKTGQPSKAALDEVAEVYSLAWSPDGKTLAVGYHDHRVRLWQAATGKQLHELELGGSPPQVTSLAWAPSEPLLASGRGNHTMQIWNTRMAKLVHTAPTMAPVQRVAWTTDGRTMVCCNSDRTTRFFDTSNGGLRGVLIAEETQVVAIGNEGHFRGDATNPDLLVVAQLDKGQEIFTPATFATKFKWKNAPSAVRLTGR